MKRKNKSSIKVIYKDEHIGNIWRDSIGWYAWVDRTGVCYSLIPTKKEAIKLVKDVHNGM